MPLAVKIREATPDDDVAVGELLVAAFVDRYATKLPDVIVTPRRKAELRDVATARRQGRVWVAELKGALIGTVALWPPGAEGSEAWLPGACDLRHLAVAPQGNGLGVSKALCDTAEQHARAVGATYVTLHVRREADGVQRLYESRGYQRRPEGDLDLLPEVFLWAFALPLGINPGGAQ